MKTVVATYLVWLKDRLRQGPPYPAISLLLVGNEENGEAEPMGTPHSIKYLVDAGLPLPELFIAGERTEERGDGLWGEICIENRGVMRFDVLARSVRGHSGVSGANLDLTEKMFQIKQEMTALLNAHLTLSSTDGWHSQARFPFTQVGTPGVYNITPDIGILGVEIRSIPIDRLAPLVTAMEEFCHERQLSMDVSVMEDGVACNPNLPELNALVKAVELQSGLPAKIGKKLPGTSARFAPGGQGVVWGQSGVGPHSNAERHFIPSILPYYETLNMYARILDGSNAQIDKL
jgi:acetylornithine deacetylase/succinyl-diaminopimelate desuccinylase-like protein